MLCVPIDDNDCYVERVCVYMISVLFYLMSLVLPAANMEGGLVD